jgi:transposase
MEKILSSQATNWREGRRLRAWELHQKGWKQQAIAEALGGTQGAVSQWLKRVKEGGVAGLRHRPPPGAAPRLSPEQRGQLLALLSQGAEAFGFQGEVWTQPRVATLIRDQFGVSYDPSQVGRILKASGWSSQKPTHRATQRNETAIWQWQEERWPQIKKGSRRRAHPGLCRPVRFLSIAWNGKNLCSSRTDPADSSSPEPRSPFCHGWYYP